MDDAGDKRNSQLSTNPVTPVSGSAWIQYRSKSHGDRIYYFNKETGAAVWNLSSAEIDKAEKSMQNIVKPLEGCPEPKLPPTNPSNYDQRRKFEESSTPCNVQYNKQIINNSFIRPPCPISSCSGMLPSGMANPGPSTALSIPGLAYNIWSVPHVGPIFISPIMSPNVTEVKTNVVNIPSACTQTSENLNKSNDNDVAVQNRCSEIFTERESQTSPRHIQSDKLIPRDNETLSGQSAEIKTQFKNIKRNEFDLRQLLSSRRRKPLDELNDVNSEFSVTGYEKLHCDDTSNADTSVAYDTGDESCYSGVDSDWLEDNVSVQGQKLRLNVTGLKKLAAPNTDTDHWYIAVDKIILLRHLNFLNTLYNSDDQCHLMVPRQVLAELRAESHNSGLRRHARRARRALTFVSHQLNAGTAVLGEVLCESSDIEIPYTLNCCLSLVEQCYHVVLISNNLEFQRYNNPTGVPIFSIKELKEYLSKNYQDEEQDELEAEQPILATSPSLDLESVKIVITNDRLNSPCKTATEKVKGNMASDLISIKERESKPQGKHANKSDELHMDDVLVQTAEPPDTFVKPKVQKTSTNNTAHALDTVNVNMNTANAGHSSQTKNISKIRLKRSISNPPAACFATNGEKKQFKWRRRRATHTNEPNSTHNLKQTESFEGQEISVIDENLLPNKCASQQNNASCDLNSESSETCIAALVQKSLSDKLVIEETSTSGVISNTTGNVDSNRSSVDKETVNRNVMFEVTDHCMEEYLTTRRDEWVSRYVQIMEEVLSQVLHQYPQLLPTLTPPPWTLHEATECIGTVFHDKKDITVAVKMLLKVLENVSEDKKSRICMHIKPSDFMQLYSYGAYLVETLQVVLRNCEDLQTAAVSLERLLYDINSPNLDSSQDRVSPTRAIPSTSSQVPNERQEATKVVNHKHQHSDTVMTEVSQESNIKELYNLRSRKRRLGPEQVIEEPEIQNPTVVPNVDVEFFTSLNLQKNDISRTSLRDIHTPQNVSSNDKMSPPNSPSWSKNLYFNGDVGSTKHTEDGTCESDKGTIEPKFIRNFSICPKFEEILAKSSSRSEFDADALNCSEYREDEYDDTDENDYYGYTEIPLETDEAQIENVFENNNSENANPEVAMNSNSNSKFIFRQIINETKEAIMQVACLCQNSSSELSNARTEKVTVLREAEEAYQHIDTLHKCLRSIFDREKIEHGNNTPSPLSKAGVEHVDQQYTDTIEKYMTEAKRLLEVLNIIITAINR